MDTTNRRYCPPVARLRSTSNRNSERIDKRKRSHLFLIDEKTMSTIHRTIHTGPDGILKLKLPLGMPDADVDVTVVVEKSKPTMNREEWLRFIERTAGKWEGEPLARPDQGDYEVRD